MRRKFLCILLLCCLTAPVLVTYGWLQYQKNLVRQDLKRKLIAGVEEEALILLKFTETDSKILLRWECSREFEYQGQMFDVVQTEVRGDTIYYRCWLDHKESDLNQKIKHLVVQTLEKDPTSQESQKRLTHFYKSLYSFEPQVLPLTGAMPQAKQAISSPIFFLRSPSIPPGVPPPEVS